MLPICHFLNVKKSCVRILVDFHIPIPIVHYLSAFFMFTYFYVVLSCPVLHCCLTCIALPYVLYCTVLYCSTVCTVRYCTTVLSGIALLCPVLQCFIQYCSAICPILLWPVQNCGITLTNTYKSNL